MAELELIAAIERSVDRRGGRLLAGPGDDAAVVRPGGVSVTSIDAIVDGVHFDSATHSPADIGHKALATALSDIAAMGAEPGEAYVALALPPRYGDERALEIVAAIEALAARLGVAVAGGDVVGSPTLAVTVTAVGYGDGPESLAYRSGARPGDLVAVTGTVGGSGAGLALLSGLELPLDPARREALAVTHRRPEPRLAAGRALAAAGATAMIDVSDGIATDAAHIAGRSGVRLDLRLASLPLADGVAEVAAALGRDPAEFAASAGDDYELLLSAPARSRGAIERAARSVELGIAWIGEVERGTGLVLRRADGSVAALHGFEHA